MSKKGYPVWWDATITLYNRYEDPQTHVNLWSRHVLTDCFWKYTGDKVKLGDAILDTTFTICRVPQDENFKPYSEWVKVPSDKRYEYFTFSQNDIIVLGEVEDVIDEYQAGHRSTDLLAKYKNLQECMQIESVSINTQTGVNNPHYYVRGI